MTTILIDIEADGEFCGDCHQRPNRYCESFEPHEIVQNGRRISQCPAATARVQELLDAEAELKRMKAAEQYEN